MASASFRRLYLTERTPHVPLTSLTPKPAFLLRPPGRYAISFHGDNLLVLWLEFEGQRGTDWPICMPPRCEKLSVTDHSSHVFGNQGFFEKVSETLSLMRKWSNNEVKISAEGLFAEQCPGGCSRPPWHRISPSDSGIRTTGVMEFRNWFLSQECWTNRWRRCSRVSARNRWSDSHGSSAVSS